MKVGGRGAGAGGRAVGGVGGAPFKSRVKRGDSREEALGRVYEEAQEEVLALVLTSRGLTYDKSPRRSRDSILAGAVVDSSLGGIITR